MTLNKIRCLAAAAVATMVSFAAFAENLARYSQDGGETWTEAENIKKALQAVQGGTTPTIIETRGDSVMTGSSAHEQKCDVILRPWAGYDAKYRFYRSTSDPMQGRWIIKSGATLTLTNIIVDAGSGSVNGLIYAEAGSTVRLEEGTEIVTSHTGTSAGSAIWVGGTVIFDGGVVSGWNVSGNAPLLGKSNSARVEIRRGGIENCSNTSDSIQSGTAICGDNVTVVMTGGFIRNNHCTSTGSGYHAAVCFRLKSEVDLSGGEITGNSGASESYCGVIAGQGGTVKISGDAVVTNNTTASGAEVNVFLGKAVGYWGDGDVPKLVQIGNLTENARVGVYSQGKYAEEAKFGTLSAPGFLGSGSILNDRDETLVGVADGTDLKWGIGGTVIVDPAIGRATAAPVGSSAVIRLIDVVAGTDGEGVPATSYSVLYSLDEADAVTALSGQTATTAQFTISGLADGPYSCKVWIETDVKTVSPAKTLSFTVDSTAPAEGDFDALKAAIEGASADEVVVVDPGLYHATSSITVSKGIRIVSSAGREHTIIDGCYPNSDFVLFRVSAEQVKVSGLTFRNSGGAAIDVGGSYHGFEAADCVFTNCHAAAGAGVGGAKIYNQHGAETAGPIPPRGDLGIVSGCLFVDCEANGVGDAGGGGAICGAFWVENSTFDNCSSAWFAPAIYTSQHMMVTNCAFRNLPMPSSSARAAIYQNRGLMNLQVLGCTFEGLTCNAPFGGASGAQMLADRCEIRNCAGTETQTSDNANPYSIFYGSGTLRNALIHENKNPFNLGSESYQNCTVVDNVGGFFIKIRGGSNLPKSSFTNCVFAANSIWKDKDGAYSRGGAGLQWHGGGPNEYKELIFSYCAIEGASTNDKLGVLFELDATGTTEELSTALDAKGPRFTDPENGDWTLKMSSPLKDTGVLCDWMTGAIDLAGNPRVVDMPDIGCYEHMKKGLLLLVR